jgi:anti-sigma factor RsiW
MGCARVADLLPFYPRGDLPRAAFAAVTRHLAGCPRCRRALRDVQATYRLLQAHLHTAPLAGPQAKAALVARLAASRPAPPAEPPAGAAVPARVPVRRRRLEAALPWLPWPGFDAEAPDRR